MNITISNIIYKDFQSSNSSLVKTPIDAQNPVYIPQGQLDAMSYQLSVRNGSGAYLVKTEASKTYLNFIPKKVHVSDTTIKDYLSTQFEYFVEAVIIPPDPFSLPEGQLFRCVSSDSTPMSKEEYSYFIIEDGVKRLIPNYLTLEVILFEKNSSLLSVRIIQEQECSDIIEGQPYPDKSQSWTDDMEDQTNFEALKGLEASVKSGAELAEGAKAAASEQIAVVQAQAEASAAQAAASQAAAEASALAAEAAIAEAQAAQAASEATQAQAQLAILNAGS